MFPKIIIVSDHSNKIPTGKARDSNFSSVFLNFFNSIFCSAGEPEMLFRSLMLNFLFFLENPTFFTLSSVSYLFL